MAMAESARPGSDYELGAMLSLFERNDGLDVLVQGIAQNWACLSKSDDQHQPDVLMVGHTHTLRSSVHVE